MNTKVIATAAGNRSLERDEPIIIPSNYSWLALIARKSCDLFWFCFSLVETFALGFKPITKRSNRNRVITFDSHRKLLYALQILSYTPKRENKVHGLVYLPGSFSSSKPQRDVAAYFPTTGCTLLVILRSHD